MRLNTLLMTAAAAAAALALTTAAFAGTIGLDDAAGAAVTAGDAPRYAVKSRDAKVKPGQDGKAKLSIVPAKGYKWNLEYPAKVTLKGSGETVELPKTSFKQLKGDFKASEKVATITIPLKGKAAGTTTLTGKAKFSVCNETSCVIEEEDVSIAVTVAP